MLVKAVIRERAVPAERRDLAVIPARADSRPRLEKAGPRVSPGKATAGPPVQADPAGFLATAEPRVSPGKVTAVLPVQAGPVGLVVTAASRVPREILGIAACQAFQPKQAALGRPEPPVSREPRAADIAASPVLLVLLVSARGPERAVIPERQGRPATPGRAVSAVTQESRERPVVQDRLATPERPGIAACQVFQPKQAALGRPEPPVSREPRAADTAVIPGFPDSARGPERAVSLERQGRLVIPGRAVSAPTLVFPGSPARRVALDRQAIPGRPDTPACPDSPPRREDQEPLDSPVSRGFRGSLARLVVRVRQAIPEPLEYPASARGPERAVSLERQGRLVIPGRAVSAPTLVFPGSRARRVVRARQAIPGRPDIAACLDSPPRRAAQVRPARADGLDFQPRQAIRELLGPVAIPA